MILEEQRSIKSSSGQDSVIMTLLLPVKVLTGSDWSRLYPPWSFSESASPSEASGRGFYFRLQVFAPRLDWEPPGVVFSYGVGSRVSPRWPPLQ